MADTSSKPNNSYIIVGAGAFGSSLALEIIQKYPSATVTIVDQCEYPSPRGASYDWNKVVRADYANLLYMELGLEAIAAWKTNPLYKPYYHKIAVALLSVAGVTDTINNNYKKLGRSDQLRTVQPEDLKSMWGGAHDSTNIDQVQSVIINDDNGWVEANNCISAVLEAAIGLGVRYQVADVQSVVLDSDGTANGVRTSNGTVLHASHVVLATGAGTAKILFESAPGRKELHMGNRLTATGYAVGTVELTDAEAHSLEQGPVFIHSVGNVLGGVLPFKNDRLLKFYREISFTNTVYHKATDTYITTPPSDLANPDNLLSPQVEKELWQVIEGIFGPRSRDWKVQHSHICWDALTQSKDFLISPHPHAKNLFILTGGSFHGFKFMPVVGKYALQMIEGALEHRLSEAWSWNQKEKASVYPVAMPSREARDVGLHYSKTLPIET